SLYNEFRLPVPGRHFASNALGVVGALKLFLNDLDLVALVKALNTFPGTERRLQQIGEYRGAPVFDDYGHHPSEISAVLSALKQRYPDREIRVVFQPHRYTRTKELAGEFARTLSQSDHAYVLPIYTAGEEAIQGIDENSILKLMDAKKASPIADLEEPFRESGEAVVLFLGAGSVSSMARNFLKERDAFQDTTRT
ncbi:MAG: hypothetical protein KDK37_07260, partial [Leptospiraceae bacterium]|nr:hypothetical protein [Leptospiraceae bacterium]